MTRRTVIGSLLPFATLSATTVLDAASGSGTWNKAPFIHGFVADLHFSPSKPNPGYKGKWYAPMIDNPEYKGEWAPRKIPNPNYFEDLTPVKSLKPIGGVGIELWTMTEDILFDNIYVGHSVEDAAALAAETWEVKHAQEEAAKKAKVADDEEELTPVSFKEDPVAFIREHVFTFIETAKVDPIFAVKSQPETAAGLTLAITTLFGMLGVLLGLIGGQQQPITKSAKKTDAPSPDDKAAKAKTEAEPAAAAGGEKADTPVKKRK